MKGFLKVDFAASGVKINSDYYVQLMKKQEESGRKEETMNSGYCMTMHQSTPPT
jgi:hypothetical protein